MQEKFSKAAAEERRKYYREYRAAHKDKVNIYNRTFWEKKAAQNDTTNQSEKSISDAFTGDADI